MTVFHHTQCGMSLWKMLNVKIYLGGYLAMPSHILNVHTFDVVIVFILQINYMIYLSMCTQKYKDVFNVTYL